MTGRQSIGPCADLAGIGLRALCIAANQLDGSPWHAGMLRDVDAYAHACSFARSMASSLFDCWAQQAV